MDLQKRTMVGVSITTPEEPKLLCNAKEASHKVITSVAELKHDFHRMDHFTGKFVVKDASEDHTCEERPFLRLVLADAMDEEFTLIVWGCKYLKLQPQRNDELYLEYATFEMFCGKKQYRIDATNPNTTLRLRRSQ